MPPLPLPSEKEEIVPDLILPGAIISTSPPLPIWDEEDNSPRLVSTLPPVLSRVILPPRPLPSERESISPVIRSPKLLILISPPSPVSEEEDNSLFIVMTPVLLSIKISPPSLMVLARELIPGLSSPV